MEMVLIKWSGNIGKKCWNEGDKEENKTVVPNCRSWWRQSRLWGKTNTWKELKWFSQRTVTWATNEFEEGFSLEKQIGSKRILLYVYSRKMVMVCLLIPKRQKLVKRTWEMRNNYYIFKLLTSVYLCSKDSLYNNIVS